MDPSAPASPRLSSLIYLQQANEQSGRSLMGSRRTERPLMPCGVASFKFSHVKIELTGQVGPGQPHRCSLAAASGHDTPDHMIDPTEQESELIHPPARLVQSFMSHVTGPNGSADSPGPGYMVLPLQEAAAAFFKVFSGNFHLVCAGQ